MPNWQHCIKKAHLCLKKIAGSDLAVINIKRYDSNQIPKTTTNLINIQNFPRVPTKVHIKIKNIALKS